MSRVWIRRVMFALVLAALSGTLVVALPAPAHAAPNRYLRMSDGVLIAMNLRMPNGWEKGDPPVPTIFEMGGYENGSASGDELNDQAGIHGSRQLTEQFNKEYATLHASVRGTGCSGGEFDLFSWRSALDGREIVEWIADQPWSNGDVGI
ncbi:MAG: hypothetical protein LC808_37910, partial [Actinobacteria bacterium]|nr:hypothetical protein [Actinomycetota bacterium]